MLVHLFVPDRERIRTMLALLKTCEAGLRKGGLLRPVCRRATSKHSEGSIWLHPRQIEDLLRGLSNIQQLTQLGTESHVPWIHQWMKLKERVLTEDAHEMVEPCWHMDFRWANAAHQHRGLYSAAAQGTNAGTL